MSRLFVVQVAKTPRLKAIHWDKIKAPEEGSICQRDGLPSVDFEIEEVEKLFRVGSRCNAVSL